MKFSARKKSNKKVIAKKPLTNLYEKNSTFSMMTSHLSNLNLLKQPVCKKLYLHENK